MKDSILAALIIVLFWAALPLLCAGSVGGKTDAVTPTAFQAAQAQPEDRAGGVQLAGRPAQTFAEPAPEAVPGFDAEFSLPVLQGSEIVQMDLHTYLTGVLLAEMPSSFADEARKAQTVASRTYCLRSALHPRHEGAAVCVNSGCCQGWRDPAAAAPEDRARAEAAVAATDGLVIRYQGVLIDATFFACSGGRTESAAAVWGSDLPYLQAVESPGEEGAAHDTDETRISLEGFRAALEAQDAAVSFPEALGGWVGEITYTPGGGVDTMELGGRPFSGTWLRKRFGLRSTVFTLELNAEEAVFTTKGYGHRVGMSQYGAQAMALAGSDFSEILKWYYQGVTVEAY